MIGFVVLHYQSTEDTLSCVSSIINICPDSIIVIVDNASPNKSGVAIANIYKNNKQIKCLLLEDNYGFAKGNNFGYKYLKTNYSCDFICCINNDTVLIDEQFESHLKNIFEDYSFGVLAPKVILRDGSTQSFNPNLHDVSYYKNELDLLERSSSYHEYLLNKGVLAQIIALMPNLMKTIRKIKQKVKKPYSDSIKNVVLHGCFLVFSNPFIKLFDEPFDHRTFMYREEELLFLRVRTAGLTTLYSEDVFVKHMEDAATNATYRNKESKYQFMRMNQIQSTKILIEELTNVKESKTSINKNQCHSEYNKTML